MAWRESFDIPPVLHTNPLPMVSRVGNMVFTSGVMGSDPATGELPDSLEQQTHNAFTNLRNALAKVGATPDDIGSLSVMVKSAANRQFVNDAWLAMFPDEHSRPARHAWIIDTLNFEIQLQAIAVVQG